MSGTEDLDKRTGLTALLDRVESNGVKIVLVENATRLARDLMVGEVILKQLTNAGRSARASSSGAEDPFRPPSPPFGARSAFSFPSAIATASTSSCGIQRARPKPPGRCCRGTQSTTLLGMLFGRSVIKPVPGKVFECR